MVWMRTAGLPDFKKLNKIIDGTLSKDEVVRVTIQNVYPVQDFSGTKSIVFSTTTWIGGKNDFLAIAYLVVGGICILLAILFGLKHWLCPRWPAGDSSFKASGQAHN